MTPFYATALRRSFPIYCLLISALLLLQYSSYAQSIIAPESLSCAVPELSPQVRQALEKEAQLALKRKQANSVFTSITYVPIRPHILRQANGTGGLTLASMNWIIAITNRYYLYNGYGIQFYFCGTDPDYVDNDTWFNPFDSANEDAVANSRDANNALNMYFVNKFSQSGLGGYARYPGNSISSTRQFILIGNDVDRGNRLIPHELGHTFNLIHTYGNNNGTGGSNELVTRGTGANCATAGDLVCDTPADPYGASNATVISGASPSCLVYTGTATDANGDSYTPPLSNIMSYYFPCTHDFTPGQYDRMQAGLATRQAHTAYSLGCPATAMAAPSNVVAAITGSNITITWQDNSSNEMGYFIERSTSPTTGFLPVGGVAPNVTTFTDQEFTSRTRYYYRVRPSNTTTGSISPTATIIAPDCRPSYTNDGCGFGISISGLTVNGATLSQNSGCSPSSSSYYTSFTAVSGTVTAGQSATFTVTKGGSGNAMGGTIWVDVNNNGAFESNERLYQTPTSERSSSFSGTLGIPLSTTASSVRMRVVAAFATVPGDPCGSYGYGETEDYVLTVRQVCNPPVASLAGSSTITAGQPTTLIASLTGTAPFSLTVNPGTGSPVSFTGITASPFAFTVSPAASTTYTLGRVSNSCGPGTVSGTATVTVNTCTVMTTVKAGNWNDPTVWSCNRIPTQTDQVQIGHLVAIPTSFLARALQIRYSNGGRLTVTLTGKLQLGP